MIRFKEKSLWKDIDKSTFGIIKVINSDTLDAALSATKIFGERFTVLNMANATGFGGGYEHGRSAQEENIFRRTDCHFSMLRNSIGGKYDDTKDHGLTMTQRINRGIVFKDQPRVCIRRGESLVPDVNMPSVEILKLIRYKWLDYYDIFQFYEFRNAAPDYRYKVFNPFYKAKEGGVKDDNTTKYPISDDAATALYKEVAEDVKKEVGKAFAEAEAAEAEEVKAAAAEVEEVKTAAGAAAKVNKLEEHVKKLIKAVTTAGYAIKTAADKKKATDEANKALLTQIVSTMRIKIINQLTQLIENNCEYVILSAFGCGAFHNHPIVVFNLYNEIFESFYDKVTPKKTYKDHFKVIIFAIYQNNPNIDNSAQFQQLENIKKYPSNVQALFAELQALLTQLDSPDPSPPP